MSTESGQPLYAAIDGRARRLGADEVVFYDPVLDRSHAMTLQVLQALERCRAFQPMAMHVAAVVEATPELKGQHGAVRRVLEGLASRGLLITDDALLRGAGSGEPALYSGHFLVADGGSAGLSDRLRELSAAAIPALVVVPIRDQQEAELAGVLRDHGAPSGRRTILIDADRRRRIVEELAGELPEHAQALRACLASDGAAGGAGERNLITLLAAGTRHTRSSIAEALDLRRHPSHRDGFGFAVAGIQAHCYRSLAEALEAGDGVDDPMAPHLALCGHRLADLLTTGGKLELDHEGLRGRIPSLEPGLRAQARVSLSGHGRRGGFALAEHRALFLLDPPSRAALLADPDRYLALREAVPAWWGTDQPRLVEFGAIAAFAFDGGRILPCVGAGVEGADRLFQALCSVLHADSCALELPLSVPVPATASRQSVLGALAPVAANGCLANLARAVASDLYAEQPAVRLAVFAARLEDLVGASDAALLAYLREYCVHRRAELLQRLQAVAAASPEAPEAWHEDLRACIEANGRAVVERAPPRFAGWPESLGASECAQRFRREALALVAALRAWPAAWDVALARRERWLA